MSKMLAKIEYKPDKFIIFYEEMITVNDTDILFSDIEEYSFGLKNTEYQVSYVPIANSTNLTIKINTFSKHKHNFNLSTASALTIKGQKYYEFADIFAEINENFDSLIAPYVVRKLLEKNQRGEVIKIGALKIQNGILKKPSFFGTKNLQIYNGFEIMNGQIVIKDGNGKSFDRISSSEMNAPLLPRLLNQLYK